MSFPDKVQSLLENNRVFAETYKTPPDIVTLGGMVKKSGQGTVILTCVDPRVVPENFMGPNIAAPVIRNGGGRVSDDAVETVVVLRALAGVKNLLVVRHTDCGLTVTTNEKLASDAKELTPDAAAEIDRMKFQCYTPNEYEDSIKEDVKKLRAIKALAGMNIYGFSLELDSGLVKPVDV